MIHRLEASHIGLRFGGLEALRDVDLSVSSGQVIGLIGPNGAGKTTLINVLTGVYHQTSGDVVVDGTSVVLKSATDAAVLHISRTFQTIRILPEMTVVQNVLVGGHMRLKRRLTSALAIGREASQCERDIRRSAEELIDWVGLGNCVSDIAGSLPYGHQRRLEFARALMTRPHFLLLDEPAAGMNPNETDELKSLIIGVREAGIAVLLVEHDMRLLMAVSDYVHVLDHGLPLADGLPSEVSADPKVVEAYLGREEDSLDLASGG